MPSLYGALKGMLGGIGLLVAVALVPTLAVGVALVASSHLDVGFWTAFVLTLLIEGFLGLCAAFGLASAVEEAHAEDIDDAGGAGGTPV
ncbi:MAG: hypothetical protein QNK04_07080 [Myxococcota bacterium]|nr:hypothetical protein [Myxococcota bacterium]